MDKSLEIEDAIKENSYGVKSIEKREDNKVFLETFENQSYFVELDEEGWSINDRETIEERKKKKYVTLHSLLLNTSKIFAKKFNENLISRLMNLKN